MVFKHLDERQRRALDSFEFGLLVLGLSGLLVFSAGRSGYVWQFYRVGGFIWSGGPGPLLEGLGLTVGLSLLGLAASFALGLLTTLLRLSSSPLGRMLARVYLELVRNTPLLIQLFLIYFVLGPILGLSAFSSAVLALSLFEGAYASEIMRAGILAVPHGQWEAAASLGLTRLQTYRHVILPQAFKKMLPPLTGLAVSLIKDSALVSTIAVYDLCLRAQMIVAKTFLSFEIWFTVAAFYLCLTLALSAWSRRLELRLKTYD